MGLALANSNAATLDGSISTAYLLNSNDPKYANNAFVKLYKAQMAKWAPNADPTNTFYYYGFAKAYDVVKLLAATGKNPTRAKLLKAARHMNWTNPGTLAGDQGDDERDRSVPDLAGEDHQVQRQHQDLDRAGVVDQRPRRHLNRDSISSKRRAGATRPFSSCGKGALAGERAADDQLLDLARALVERRRRARRAGTCRPGTRRRSRSRRDTCTALFAARTATSLA